MESRYTIHIFRNDLRIEDNLCLIKNIKSTIIPIFILNPHQISPHTNDYFTKRGFTFMCESLMDLSVNCPITIYKGTDIKCLEDLYQKFYFYKVTQVADYTPFAKDRSMKIQKWCNSHKIHFEEYHDRLLLESPEIFNLNNTAFKKFTPFYKHVIERPISKPSYKQIAFQPAEKDHKLSLDLIIDHKSKDILKGGRTNALQQLKKHGSFDSLNHGSLLSVYLKFGCLSIREAYKSFLENKDTQRIRQLYWRDYYYIYFYYYPQTFTKDPSWYDLSKNNQQKYANWKNASTNNALVNAIMTELNTTGIISNRARLIVACFLIHDLGLHWSLGELHFAHMLLDYDPCQNMGGWLWFVGKSVNLLNIDRQREKYDPHKDYIKKNLSIHKI